MPTRLPDRRGTHAILPSRTTDRLAIAALSVAFFGLLLAVILYLTGGDYFIATYVMFVTAAIAMLLLRWDVDPHAPN